MRGKVILVIDDDVVIEDALNAMLFSHGFRTASFNDPRDALRFFREHHQIIDLVVTDWDMPAMGGNELAREMVYVNPRVPVVLMKGTIEQSPEIDSSPNIRIVLEKPVSGDVLIRAVGALTSRRGLAPTSSW